MGGGGGAFYELWWGMALKRLANTAVEHTNIRAVYLIII